MEANQNITMEPYNIEYYIAKYGTVEKLTKDYIGAIDGLRLQYRQYETNPRKGGRYRREKMEHLRQQAEAIYQELLRVSRAMKDYFAAQATETPQISTEAAEVTNVSAVGGNAENEPQKHISEVLKEAERNYQCVKSETLRTVREADGKLHTYFMDDEIGTDLAYDQINHIPSARTAQAAEEVAEIRRYLNRLNGNHIADADYYLAEMRDGIRQAEAARRKKNAEAEGEKAAERAENKPYYTHRWRVLHNCDLKTWDKFHKKHKEAILIFHHETTYTALQKEAVKVSEMCDIAYEVNRHGVEVCLFNDATLTQIIEQGIYVAIAELPKVPDYGLTDAPQSPETPQEAVEPANVSAEG